MAATTWNPWHGCRRCSEACDGCYLYTLDRRYGRDTEQIVKNTASFDRPVQKTAKGAYWIGDGTRLDVGTTSDFFIADADGWRDEVWGFIRERPGVTFSLLTKRAARVADHLPEDWGDGWDNVRLVVSVENQYRADERIPQILRVPSRHTVIHAVPMLGRLNLAPYLLTGSIEEVVAGGEYYPGSRPLNHEWVRHLSEQCRVADVPFTFAQAGKTFVQDGTEYRLGNPTAQKVAAAVSNLNHPKEDVEEAVRRIVFAEGRG